MYRRSEDIENSAWIVVICLVVGIILVVVGSVLGRAHAQDASGLSVIERLQLDNAGLLQRLSAAQHEANVCRGELAPLLYKEQGDDVAQRVHTLTQAVEQAHPGFRLDLSTGRLVPSPAKDGGK